ncbi:hypothetical protein BC830DRAFT_1223469 [Chytriomyces sp. MP71]|nr:hypothetical protein BC830DRAFT_1223469 [Chytriomyces sp. MP71]
MSDLALGDETSGVQEAAVSVKKCGHLAAAVNVNKLKKAVTASLLANAKCQRCPKYRGAGNDALWLCLKCAVVHCGRNDADHARLHFCAETDSKHCVAAALDSAAAVWCHACDEFVVLDSSAKRNLVLADVKAVLRDARVSAPNVRSADGMASADHPSLPVTPPPIASSKVPVRGLSGAKPAKIRPQTPGLQNLGNTCFFNSVMQCLVYTDALIPYYANGVKDGAGAKQDEVVGKALSKAFLNFLNVVKTQLRAAKTTTVSPVGLFTQLKLKYEAYRMMSQQDAHELLRTLLGGIKDEQTPRDVEGREIRTGEPGCAEYGSIFVDKVFGGKLVSVVLCATCKGVSYQFEEFLDLSLSLNMDGPGSEKKKGIKPSKN